LWINGEENLQEKDKGGLQRGGKAERVAEGCGVRGGGGRRPVCPTFPRSQKVPFRKRRNIKEAGGDVSNKIIIKAEAHDNIISRETS